MLESTANPPQITVERIEPRPRLSASVAEQLLSEIRRGGLAPGTRMPSERSLMELLGVGRSTVREAINRLAMLGVVEVKQGQGAFVSSGSIYVTAPEMATALERGVTRDLLEARLALEVETARLAALRRTSEHISAIASLLARHRTLLDQGEPAAVPSAAFHVHVAEAAGNDVLAGFIASIASMLVDRGPILEQIDGYREWELEDHALLFDAIERQDPELSATRMRSHLEQVAEYYDLRNLLD